VTIQSVVYDDRGTTEYDEVDSARTANGTTWIRASNATAAEREAISEAFGIHPLAIEDVFGEVRAKTEEFPTYTFVLVKSVELTRGETTFDEEVLAEPIGLFVGEDWIVSLAPGADEPIERVWEAVQRGDERILQRGPDFTAYRIVDAVVDEYFQLLDHVGEQIERVEDDVLVSTEIETLEAINAVRRDLLSFRKLAWPMREALGVLSRGDPDQVAQETEKYYRDVYDHLVQVVDLVETYRDLTTGARDIYLNTLSQSTNEVMKVLTVIATIFLPLTFVVGVYGMNFEGGPYNMPELGWEFGYPAVMLGMVLVALLMAWGFRERGYI